MGVTRETATGPGTVGEDEETAPRPFGPRGRHRRPRPRKVLLAAGGFALAAGALSLVRLAPESDVTTLGTARSDPAPVAGTDTATQTDRSTNTAATVGTSPARPGPSATSAMGGPGRTPRTATVVVPTGKSAATPPRGGSGAPSGDAQAQSPAPRPPARTTQAPRPATTPSPKPTPAPSSPASQDPQPDQPYDDAVCVPVIGLCVDRLSDGD